MKKILDKLNIETLTPLQSEAVDAFSKDHDLIILSPTGTGKTVAFLLPLLQRLNKEVQEVQALILAPSRELAIQIEQVARQMGTGLKINVCYGGRPIIKDKTELATLPQLLVGTPGRILDHLERGTFNSETIEFFVLDEFDKSLEIGFEDQIEAIVDYLPYRRKNLLTSATALPTLPRWLRLNDAQTLKSVSKGSSALQIKSIISEEKDKLNRLTEALHFLQGKNGIVFCNFKESIQRVSDHLKDHDIPHGCFYGGLDQIDRERALIKFRNGTHQILIATDLAARGLDINNLDFILHYHLPLKEQEFTHRNGRTARMNNDGIAYVLHWKNEALPEFIPALEEETMTGKSQISTSGLWTTLFVSGGRKDKISKGDIVGLFIKTGGVKSEDLGIIELKNDCAFVAVKSKNARSLISKVNNIRLKKKKVRVKML